MMDELIIKILNFVIQDIRDRFPVSKRRDIRRISKDILLTKNDGNCGIKHTRNLFLNYQGKKDEFLVLSKHFVCEIWITCYLVSKFCIESGLIIPGDDKCKSISLSKNPNQNKIDSAFRSCFDWLRNKTRYRLIHDNNGLNESTMQKVLLYYDNETQGFNKNTDTQIDSLSQFFLVYALEYMFAHEFGHIYYKHKPDLALSLSQEQAADIFGIQQTKPQNNDNNLLFYIEMGVLCTHLTDLFTKKQITEGIEHPDPIKRLKYSLDMLTLDKDIYSLVVSKMVKLWAKINYPRCKVIQNSDSMDSLYYEIEQIKKRTERVLIRKRKKASPAIALR